MQEKRSLGCKVFSGRCWCLYIAKLPLRKSINCKRANQNVWMTSETRLKQWDYNMNKKNLLNFISFCNCSPSIVASLFLNSHYLTTCLSFLKISKLIFSARYFESYFNLKLGHFYWDTQYNMKLTEFLNQSSLVLLNTRKLGKTSSKLTCCQ